MSLCGSQLSAVITHNWDNLAYKERSFIWGHSFTGVHLWVFSPVALAFLWDIMAGVPARADDLLHGQEREEVERKRRLPVSDSPSKSHPTWTENFPSGFVKFPPPPNSLVGLWGISERTFLRKGVELGDVGGVSTTAMALWEETERRTRYRKGKCFWIYVTCSFFLLSR